MFIFGLYFDRKGAHKEIDLEGDVVFGSKEKVALKLVES